MRVPLGFEDTAMPRPKAEVRHGRSKERTGSVPFQLLFSRTLDCSWAWSCPRSRHSVPNGPATIKPSFPGAALHSCWWTPPLLSVFGPVEGVEAGAEFCLRGGGGSKGVGWVGLPPPPPAGDPELLEVQKKFFGLN